MESAEKSGFPFRVVPMSYPSLSLYRLNNLVSSPRISHNFFLSLGMTKERSQKYRQERYCPPYGYPPINYGKDIPPVEEEKKDPPKWYLS